MNNQTDNQIDKGIIDRQIARQVAGRQIDRQVAGRQIADRLKGGQSERQKKVMLINSVQYTYSTIWTKSKILYISRSKKYGKLYECSTQHIQLIIQYETKECKQYFIDKISIGFDIQNDIILLHQDFGINRFFT